MKFDSSILHIFINVFTPVLRVDLCSSVCKKMLSFYQTSRFLVLHTFMYPVSTSLNYVWSFGSLAAIFLFIQIITGLLLSVHYVASPEMAFNSVELITREVSN